MILALGPEASLGARIRDPAVTLPGQKYVSPCIRLPAAAGFGNCTVLSVLLRLWILPLFWIGLPMSLDAAVQPFR